MMKKLFSKTRFFGASLFALALVGGNLSAETKDFTQYINPYIGTAYNGHTFPGVAYPFGMVQPGADTGNASWHYCSGYRFDDEKIESFSQNHLSGTGAIGLGYVAFMPFVGDPESKSYTSTFNRENEVASPYYYSVVLNEAKSKVEITATERVAFYKITFEEDGGGLTFDFQKGLTHNHKDRVISADIQKVDDYTIIGHQRVRDWAMPFNYYFTIKFDKPIKELIEVDQPEGCKAPRWSLLFDLKKGDTIKAKVAMSFASKEGSTLNLETELPHWNFEKTVASTKSVWNNILSKIEIEGTDDDKASFYTGMVRLFTQPNVLSDVDGSYQNSKDELLKMPKGEHFYGTFSLWDTFRAAHPMYTIIDPKHVNDFVASMLTFYDDTNYLPIWQYLGKETYTMVGVHSISVIAEAIAKGFDGFDHKRALDAMVVSSEKDIESSDMQVWENRTMYEKYGYYPFDLVKAESISRTLECSYNDYAIAVIAQKLGDDKIFKRFWKLGRSFENVFDPETKLMRGKDSDGKWREPFDPFEIGHIYMHPNDYTEGNSWQYSWHVLQDPQWLIEAMGGNEEFIKKLDFIFTAEGEEKKNEDQKVVDDVTGLIGQYAHGNEPSHHVIYLYTLAGAQDKAAHYVREVFDRFYLNKPDGLCGNDDCGQMSAWYMFSAMGFYPVNPVSAEYVLGAPQIPSATIHLDNGKTFRMIAHNLSKENKYVKSVKLDGKPYDKKTISHADIMRGATLEFEMYSK